MKKQTFVLDYGKYKFYHNNTNKCSWGDKMNYKNMIIKIVERMKDEELLKRLYRLAEYLYTYCDKN